MAKSILIIGNIEECTGLIGHALGNGYRILCIPNLSNGISFLDQEDLGMVIVTSRSGYVDIMRNPAFIGLVESEVPVVLARGEKSESIVEKIFQDQVSVPSPDLAGDKDINGVVERLVNGTEGEAMEDCCVVLRRARNFISVEMNEGGNGQRRIRRAIKFMKEHYSDRLSLEQIAHAAYLSPYHFCRLFKNHAGMTCSKYLSILRVDRAKHLLKETDLSVSEVCFETGFNSLAYFDRVFKGLEGTTPSEYRQRCW